MPIAEQQQRPPTKESPLGPDNVDSDSDGGAIGVPIDPLSEAKLTGTQRRDDVDAFVQKAQWYQAFKHLLYVQAMRKITTQPRESHQWGLYYTILQIRTIYLVKS